MKIKKLILIGFFISFILLSGCNSFNSCFEKCVEIKGCDTTNRINYHVDCSYHNAVYNRSNNAIEIKLKCYDECRGK